jgi:hypothetical protein
MVVLFFVGGLLILIGLGFAFQKDVYFSFDFMCVPIKEGKLNEHDAMWFGIAVALIGTLLVGIGIYQYFKNKSKPSS